MKRLLLCAITLLCFLTTTTAQFDCVFNVTTGQWVKPGTNDVPCTNTIITSVPFLRITPDARSGAMGDAGIAISPDANSIHYNSSKLAFAIVNEGSSRNASCHNAHALDSSPKR